MQFTVKYTYKDIYEANKLIFRKRKRFFRIALKIFSVALFTLFMASIFIEHKLLPSAVDTLLFLTVTIIYLAVFPILASRTDYKKYLKNGAKPVHFNINEDGIKTDNELGNTSLKWSTVNFYVNNNKVLVLIIYNGVSNIVIPKSALVSEEAWDKLIKLVADKINVNK